MATATTATYQVHPAADVFPLLSDSDLSDLAKDIARNGLKDKIVLWRRGDDATAPAYLLDGRNRLAALKRAGLLEGRSINEYAVELTSREVPDPAAFVISKNINRRHLTKTQRAELILQAVEATTDAAKLARSVPRDGNGRVRGSSKDAVLTSATQVAESNGISKRTMQRVRTKGKAEAAPPQPEVTLPPADDLRAGLRRFLEEGRRRMRTLNKVPLGQPHTDFIGWMRAELDRIAGPR